VHDVLLQEATDASVSMGPDAGGFVNVRVM